MATALLISRSDLVKKSSDLNDYVETQDIPSTYKAKPRGTARATKVERDRADRGRYPSKK